MSDVATASISDADSVRIDLAARIDTSNQAELDVIVRLIVQGVKESNEVNAQMGFFTDGISSPTT